MRLLLFWSMIHLQTPVTVTHGVSETNSKVNPEFLEEKWRKIQTKPKITVNVILGNATELQCRNESSEGKHYIHILCLSLLLRMSYYEMFQMLISAVKCVSAHLFCRIGNVVADPIWIIWRKIQV